MAFSEDQAHPLGTTTAEPSNGALPGTHESREPSPGRPTSGAPATGLATAQIGRWAKVHWGLLLVALAVLIVAGQGQHFFYDEWAFLGSKLDGAPFPDIYLQPHNEHWTMLPLLAYRVLHATAGVGSYWPYLGLLLLLHLGVTHALWRLMLLTGSKPLVATALAAVFSILGAGAENLVWAFQIAFVGSTLLGLAALCLAVTGRMSLRRTGIVTSLITAGLATSGVGLAYLIVVPFILGRRRRWHGAVAFGLPLLVYVTWYAAYGRSLTFPPNSSVPLPLMVGAFALIGLSAALTGFFGLENDVAPFFMMGALVLVALATACWGWIAQRSLAGRVPFGMCVGAVAFFSTTGLARGGLGLGIAISSRYVYVAVALLLPALALLISRAAGRHKLLVAAVVPLSIAMSASQVSQLLSYAGETRARSTASLRVLVAASDLVNSNGPLFADQPPDPLDAPDLTTTDLGSGHLDAAFREIRPEPSDRLTASLNLQIQVAPVVSANRGQGAASRCSTTFEKAVTVQLPANAKNSTFAVNADGQVGFTLQDAGSSSAERLIVLSRGVYRISSLRGPADLRITSTSPTQHLAKC